MNNGVLVIESGVHILSVELENATVAEIDELIVSFCTKHDMSLLTVDASIDGEPFDVFHHDDEEPIGYYESRMPFLY